MAKIYLGPAGVPHSAKKKNTVEGIRTVKELGLNAMEVEFVQGVRMSKETAEETGQVARELGVRLSVHAPYFINLCSEEKEKIEASKQRILDTADRAELMGADAIAIHIAFYGKMTPEECYQNVKEGLEEVIDKAREMGIRNVKFGVETMAKETAFGTLDEVISISKELKGVIPYIDWAHTFARQGGEIDYGKIIDRLIKELGLTHINSHFESLVYRRGKYVDEHIPIDANAPPFEPLAKELLKRDISITLICESPELERDALKMKEVLERLGYRLE
ncbi:endonuclease IV [Saccharolobus solfataricus]|nr:deoxyribonuclease IV [Saccharolobus solfataricus]AKA74945.1 endonuclease IV [Saccharolobus solfataricus]AKA77641.1 endonuclease IV [Saccharolobus solfataricus]AKA80332.1 endonuclease IV [Saccharolobus solfataricus]AZF69410.1 endonuclease IV [Saccharolobus solfataricus]AZF72030.1 endonuclease IV [Saccharolobus solfataricus]